VRGIGSDVTKHNTSFLDEGLQPLRHYYLGDQAEIQKAIQAVAQQGKKK